MDEVLKYSKDGKVVFRDSDHSYRFTSDGENYKKDEKLISVTTIIHTYVPPFDPDGSITANYAEENGLSINDVKKYWEVDNHLANVYGTMVHTALENYILGKDFKLKSKYRWILDEFKKMEFKGKLYPEKLLFSEKHKLAGQCDLTEILPDGSINILDFKTNKELLMVNEYGNKMLKDFWYLDDVNFNHYRIQLSIYSRLYAMKGLKINSLKILYFNRYLKKMEIHEFQPLHKEVDIILNNRLKEIA